MTSRRGRPSTSKEAAAEKKAAIIQVAKELFQEQGVEQVSMRKLAAAAGMGTMTIYQYFPGKTEILHHLWGEFFKEVFVDMAAAIETHKDPEEQLASAYKAYVAYFLKHPDRFRMVFMHEDRADSENRFFVDHANVEETLNDILMPVEQRLGWSERELTLFNHTSICFVNGLLTNLITISEFDWCSAEEMLDHYLDGMLFKHKKARTG